MKPDASRRAAGPRPRAAQPHCVSSLIIPRRLIPLAVAAAYCAGAVASERTAGEQLERMASAMRTLSYEGTLVYLHSTRLETLRIVHRIENGRAHEQLVSLNGPVRTLTRERDQVTCELPNSHPISVQRRGLVGDILRPKAIDPDALDPHYFVHPLGSARVADRQTEVVGIIPRDNLRYGYRFFLDLESGLPLKSDLMGQEAEPIEQIMFTALELIPEDGGPPVATGADEVDAPPAAPQPQAEGASDWHFNALPPGFRLVMQDRSRDAAGQPVEHFVLSDGLASVSVYVENDSEEGLDGTTRIGAIHAAGGRLSGHQVTVVGEVPSATVDAVLAGIRYSDRGRP